MDFSQEHHIDLRVRKTREAIKNTFKDFPVLFLPS